MINNYYIKYIKYKKKYINFKKQIGGVVNTTQFKNLHIVADIVKNMISCNVDLLIGKTFILSSITEKDKDIEYTINNYLGSGGSGRVYQISSGGNFYVIKIGNEYTESSLVEMVLLDELMHEMNGECDYKAISGGIQRINKELTVYHIIFPYKGTQNMMIVLQNLDNIYLIPLKNKT